MRRRTLLKGLGSAAALGMVGGYRSPLRAGPTSDRKLIIIQFGGGTRCSETIDDPEHRWTPRLWDRLIPRGTLFANVRVEHKVVHPNSTGSMMTGHWEWDDLDWSRPVAHPTVFEIYRRARRTDDLSCWAFVYASILAKTGESLAEGYGSAYGANVVTPPTIPRATAETIDGLVQRATSSGSAADGNVAMSESARLCRESSTIDRGGWHSSRARTFMEGQVNAWRRGDSTSHDQFLTERAIACMRRFEPAVMSVCFGEIDCAHYGSWSAYVNAIRRTDELTWRIWQAAETIPAYRGNTLVLVLPDHGRELGEFGFVHHSNFYDGQGEDEGCRRVWMLALGPGLAQGRRVAGALPLTACAATGLEFLDLAPSRGAADSALGLAS